MVKFCRYILITGVILLSLCACGQKTDNADGCVFELRKDGSVSYTLIEPFPSQITNENGDVINLSSNSLKKLLDEEIKDFNDKAPHKRVTLKSFETFDGLVKIAADFDNIADFSEFSFVECFVGTIDEAKENGYDLSKVKLFENKKDGGAAGTEVLADKSYCILIMKRPEIFFGGTDLSSPLDNALTVNAYNNIVYIDENVSFISKKQVLISPGDGLAYMIFKQ